MNIDLLLCILGMALVTLIPRVMPVTLLAGRELPPLLTRWLSFVPVSVLAALVAPDLLLADGKHAVRETERHVPQKDGEPALHACKDGGGGRGFRLGHDG